MPSEGRDEEEDLHKGVEVACVAHVLQAHWHPGLSLLIDLWHTLLNERLLGWSQRVVAVVIIRDADLGLVRGVPTASIRPSGGLGPVF